MHQMRSARWLVILACVTPIGVCFLARLGAGPLMTPASTSASEAAGLAPPAAFSAAAVLDEPQSKAIAFSRVASDEPFGPSPFYEPTPAGGDAGDAPVDVDAPAEIGLDPVPTLRVTSIVSGGRETMAVVNGELRRVDDEAAPGWRIVAIQPQQGRVIVQHADGRRESARLRRPE